MVTEFPGDDLVSFGRYDAPMHEVRSPEPTEHDLLGQIVFFVTPRGVWPAIVVGYDETTRSVDAQVFNKKDAGTTFARGIRHISTHDGNENAPRWAWRHEVPVQSEQREQDAPRRAHTRKQTGGLRV